MPKPPMSQKIKALVLFSGGLDSMLAVKVLQEQGIKVTTLSFKSYFFPAARADKTVDINDEHLQVVKKPAHDYGRAANPCIDCHLLMLKKAKIIMERDGYHFVATGEVLGERPLSQNKQALLEIAQKSGLGERLLRPLSAIFLPISLPEKKGWVDRQKLPAIKGRSRQKQLALAKQFGIKNFPQPAGGCLLTDKIFGQKLLTLFKKWPQADGDDIQLLKLGRYFWQDKVLIVLGRNQQENEQLEKLVQKEDILITPQNFPGPTALLRGQKVKAVIKQAQKLILKYTKKQPKKAVFTLTAPANHNHQPDISDQA